jgi:hypothetical protein
MGLLDYEKWCWPIGDALDEQTIRMYTLRSTWSVYDAIILSIGYKPPRSPLYGDFMKKPAQYPLIEDAVLSLFRSRCDSVESALYKELTCSRSRRKYQGLTDLAVNAREFVSWLESKGLSCPSSLVESIKRSKPLRFGEILELAQKTPSLQVITFNVKEQNQPAQKFLEQSRHVKHSVFSEIGKRKGQLMRDFVGRVKEYATGEIDRGCKCSQGELADILMVLRRGDGLLFPDPRPLRPASKRKTPLRNYFVEATGKARKEKGLLLQGEKGYAKEECELHTPRK